MDPWECKKVLHATPQRASISGNVINKGVDRMTASGHQHLLPLTQ